MVRFDASVKRFKVKRYSKENCHPLTTVHYTKQNWLYYTPGVLPIGYTNTTYVRMEPSHNYIKIPTPTTAYSL